MPLDKVRERLLIIDCQAARQQDDKAAFDISFTLLHDGHHAGLMAVTRRITRSKEDAEEVSNDAFRDLDQYLLNVDPGRGCFGLLRLFAFRRAAEKYARL